MLITRFHKLIRHKVVWAIIATIVSIIFLLPLSLGTGSPGGNGNAAGILFGKEVSQDAYRQALFFETQLGENRNLTEAEYVELQRQAWRRIAMLQAAGDMGITVPDEEISRMLHEEKGFQSNGIFDRERYNAFVRSKGVDLATFEDYLRQNLAIQKLLSVLEASSWTAPSDLDRRLRNLTDLRRIEYAVLKEAQFTNQVAIGDADVEAYYAANQESFRTPARVQVEYVTFPYTRYTPTNAPDDSQVRDYYDLHTTDFVDPANTNAYAMPAEFDTVRTNIIAILSTEAARFAARDAATEFVMDLAPDRDGNHVTFDALAASNGLTIQTTPLFTADDVPASVDADPAEFARAAFNLIPDDPQYSFSDSIPGSNAVYVLNLKERQESRIPELKEIAKRVRALAEQDAQRKAFHAWAESQRARLAAEVSPSNDFRTVTASLGGSVVTTGVFTVLECLNTNVFDDAQFLVEAIVELEQGGISDVVPVGSRALIVHMAGREVGKASDVYALRPQLQRTLQEFNTRMVFSDWGDHLLETAQLQDFMAPATNSLPES